MNLLRRIPNFNQPIDALEICHENITERMKQMAAMAEELRSEGAEALNRQGESWREIFSFIRHSISNHSRDEEHGLFPILREQLGDMIEALERDHDWAEKTEQLLMTTFERFMERTPSQEEIRTFADQAAALAAFYQRHIELENGSLFPAARQCLTSQQIEELGRLMRAHRRIEISMPEPTADRARP